MSREKSQLRPGLRPFFTRPQSLHGQAKWLPALPQVGTAVPSQGFWGPARPLLEKALHSCSCLSRRGLRPAQLVPFVSKVQSRV